MKASYEIQQVSAKRYSLTAEARGLTEAQVPGGDVFLQENPCHMHKHHT